MVEQGRSLEAFILLRAAVLLLEGYRYLKELNERAPSHHAGY